MTQVQEMNIVSKIMESKLQMSARLNQSSDYFHFDPKTSGYKCYSCNKPKSAQSQRTLVKKQTKGSFKEKKKPNLTVEHMNSIIIKPWHPFLREYQTFFKNKLQHEEEKDAVLPIYECVRRLREKLLEVCNYVQSDMKASILETLNLSSIEEVEFQQKGASKEAMKNRLCYQMQERRIQDLKAQVAAANEQVRILSQPSNDSLRENISKLVAANKENSMLITENSNREIMIKTLESEVRDLHEENAYLYYLVKLERHKLFENLMQQYPADQLLEVNISLFEQYLEKLEQEITQLKLQKTKLEHQQLFKESINESQNIQQQVKQDIKIHEEQWAQEKYRLVEQNQMLQTELKNTLKQSDESKNLCRNLQAEIDKLRAQLFECQNSMDNVCHLNQILRGQVEQLNKEISELKQTISNLEIHQRQNNSTANINQTTKELALIILSKQKLNAQQTQLLQQYFGEYTDQLLQNHSSDNEAREQVQSDPQQEQLILEQKILNEKLQDQLSVFMDKLNQIQFEMQSPGPQCLKNIQDILNDKLLPRVASDIHVQDDLRKSEEQYMLLMQAIVIEEMIKQAEQAENFSDDHEGNGQNFPQIDEEEERETDEEQDLDQSSFHHPEPHENDNAPPNYE